MSSARHALVRGRVQGVGFRYAARERARRLGLVGWVRNLADGRVELHVQGGASSLADFEVWLAAGPPGAVIDALEIEDAAAGSFERFEILR